MKVEKHRAVSLSGLVLLLLLPASAGAYVWYEDPASGKCVSWGRREVVFVLNQSCRIGGSIESCERIVQGALKAWSDPTCSDLVLTYGGTTRSTEVGYDPGSLDNINLIIVQTRDWNYEPSASGRVTVVFDQSAHIRDADIELNGVDYTLDSAQAHNVLLQGVGRALGFDTSTDPDSVMFGNPESYGEERSLSTDDVDGLCHVYPAGAATPDCNANGSDGGDTNGDNGGGCSCSLPEAGRGAPAWLFCLALLLLGTRRKR